MKFKLALLSMFILLASMLAACSGPGSQAQRTPIPMVAQVALAAPSGPGKLAAVTSKDHCLVRAVDLLGAWAAAGAPEKDSFEFKDANGKTCQAAFPEDVSFLFWESNVWFDGAIACKVCHGPDLKYSYAQMDLSAYAGIQAGSRRASADAKGQDIMGSGNWEQAKLRQVLVTKFMPLGRPSESPENGPLVLAGKPK